jgi:hypothetical protein
MGWGTGRPPVNVGSGTLASFLSRSHAFRHSTVGSGSGMEKWGSISGLERTEMSTLPRAATLVSKPCRSRAQKSNSTGQDRAPYNWRPHTASQRLPYIGSLKESSNAAPNRRTIARSQEIDVMTHRIIAHRMSRTPWLIPSLEQDLKDPRAWDR